MTNKEEKEEFVYIDKPDYPKKRSKYIKKVVALDNKDDQFSAKQFQKVRSSSTKKDVIESFRRIGMCLDKIKLSTLPKEQIQKVCFVTICNFDNSNESLGVAPLNDAYLFSFIHSKLGYKIFFLYNPDKARFVKCLKFLLTRTTMNLTIYYSGLDSFSLVSQVNHGIKFNYYENLTDIELGTLVGSTRNSISKVFVFADCSSGGCIISTKAAKTANRQNCPDIVSFSCNKKDLTPKEKRISTGLLTYYFCKLMMQFADSSVKRMTELLNMSMRRFEFSITPELTGTELLDRKMILGADTVFRPAPPAPAAQ